MTELDHIAVVAPDIAMGVAWVREVLGVDPPKGGAHPEMGTHNHLLRLGDDVFLEVIAVDPKASRPKHRRWFGLDDSDEVNRHWRSGHRLRAYVARCTGLADTIGTDVDLFGAPMRLSRGDLRWTFGVPAHGGLPLDGALPYLLDWGDRGTPVPSMPDLGLKLQELVVETPFPERIRTALDALRMVRRPQIRHGNAVRLFATIDTPRGIRTLS